MAQPIIAIVGGLLLLGFIGFAFRQGMKVTPDDRADRSGQTNFGNYGGGSGDGSS
jgi:hypothetical protein